MITLDAVERVRRSDLVVIPIVTVFSSMEDEHSAKRRGVSGAHGYAARFRAEVEYQWTKRTLIPRDVRAITESARVLVNYQSVADQVRAIPGHAPIEIVPYATEAAFEEPLRPRPRPKALAGLGPAAAPLLVRVSRHDSRKGLDVLIEALGILRRSDIPFRACLVGPGPLLETHRRLARAHGIGDSVELVGYAPDPVAYLQHADVFCLPSLQEGSGSLSLLEAMQTGATIVASDVDGIPEDVTDGESAVLVPPGDAGALADGLARVLGDTQLRNRLAGRARVVFEERFSADVFSRSVRDLYHELLREASAGG